MAAVDWRMAIFSQLWKGRDVEQMHCYWLWHCAYCFLNNQLCWMMSCRGRFEERIFLPLTVPCIWLSPVTSTVRQSINKKLIAMHGQANMFCTVLCRADWKKAVGVWMNLLHVIWRNPLEEDSGFCSINVGLDPFSPRRQGFLVCDQAIHVVISSFPDLNKLPSMEDTHTNSQLLAPLAGLK